MSRFIYIAAFALLLVPARTAPVAHDPLPVEAKRGCTDYTTWPYEDRGITEACIRTVYRY